MIIATLALLRFVAYMASTLLFGASAAGAERVARRGVRRGGLAQGVARRPVAGMLSVLCLCHLQTASIAGEWQAMAQTDMLANVALQTRRGQAWILGGGDAAGAVPVSAAPAGLDMARARLGPGPLLLALSGHAAMEEGRTGLLHALNDMLHCLAAGFWLGSLPVFLLILRRWTEPACRADATRALMRFSTAGHVAVAVLLLGGVVNAVLILSPEGLDIASAYQQWLGLKVLLALAMTVLAIMNRYWWVPQDPATAGNRAWAVAPEHCAGSLRGRGDLADRERAWAVSAAMNAAARATAGCCRFSGRR